MPTLADLTDPNAVKSAIAECDRLGRDAFLSTHRYGPAKSYFLLYGGQQYDSKAIAGVAVGYQTGQALRASEFSGGAETVVPRLRSLGFEVLALKLDEATAALPEELSGTFEEGLGRSVIVNRWERSAEARLACIEAQGSLCAICGIDFSAVYGEEFAGLIHVHHLVRLADRRGAAQVDPVRDLLPVCPNCHAVIHHGGRNRAPEEVRAARARASARADQQVREMARGGSEGTD